MKTTQEKIDEIHAILLRQESRARWRLVFTTIFRLIILSVTLAIILFPSQVIGALMDMIMPLMQEAIEQVIQSQKDAFSAR